MFRSRNIIGVITILIWLAIGGATLTLQNYSKK